MFNSSIKRFLLFYLLLSITIISSLTAMGNYFLDRHTIQEHSDGQLIQTVYFIRALISSHPSELYIKRLQSNISYFATISPKKRHKSHMLAQLDNMQFTVWNEKGLEILRTPRAPDVKLSKSIKPGFSTRDIKKNTWRILRDDPRPSSQMTIIVAERYDSRRQLQNQMTWGNVLMLLWSFPLIGLLIWLVVDRGLCSLSKITSEISERQATQLTTVDIRNLPIEVRPLIQALNQLFRRLFEAFERNKRFSSDAAHEMRTPLAALKTQAQVALRTTNEDERKAGLRKVIRGVDRCTHVVDQLLTLSRLGPEATLNDTANFDISKLAAEMIAQLAPLAFSKDIDIELNETVKNLKIWGNETSISILMRNLIDNAIRYTPPKGRVLIETTKVKDRILFSVKDSGSGIPPELRTRVFERFYRVLGTQASGSGLGLAIVQQIADMHSAKISLGSAFDGVGLDFTVSFPNPKMMGPHQKRN
jgi:two-component system, OmpR family, sensor histidine kinase QseC